MLRWRVTVIFTVICLASVSGAVIDDDGEVEQQGLYSKSDHLVILTKRNFERKVFGQNHALLVQFYNSYCGHCRGFAPKFKAVASSIQPWRNVFQLAVMDCSNEENNDVCRDFEVMAYPTLRYLHENYRKGNANIGDRMSISNTPEDLKSEIIHKLQSEQTQGRLRFAPLLSIAAYSSYSDAMRKVPQDLFQLFFIFENENSTIGSELALDINDYQHILVRRVLDSSNLAQILRITTFPALVAAPETTPLPVRNPSKENLLTALNTYLKNKDFLFPNRKLEEETKDINGFGKPITPNVDIVYYSDLEITLKNSLHTEITRYKVLTGEPLNALLAYLDVLIAAFPFKIQNLKDYLVDLRNRISLSNQWTGKDISDLVKQLEEIHAPIYTPILQYIGCKGSQPHYRGYTCGLWTLFHTLTVNAVNKRGLLGPQVLRAMHGYIKNFFGCTECSEHFQAMADRNKLFEVNDNDKAVLWLWISHNEVNLRLAGDVTEDPEHPKIQFPSIDRCRECRLSRGAWNLPAVYEYLQKLYGAENIQDMSRSSLSATAAPSPFTNMDLGMLSLLYILSLLILILVIKLFLTKRFYRKRFYKHGWGKV